MPEKRVEIWKKYLNERPIAPQETPDFSLEESLNVIIKEFIGYGKTTMLKSIDRVQDNIDGVRNILLSKFKVRLGQIEVRLRNIEEKLDKLRV